MTPDKTQTMSHRNPRCIACGKRPRGVQPSVIMVNRTAGEEGCYHTRPKRRKKGARLLQLKCGEAYDVYAGADPR
jgi:hypothetical protein